MNVYVATSMDGYFMCAFRHFEDAKAYISNKGGEWDIRTLHIYPTEVTE